MQSKAKFLPAHAHLTHCGFGENFLTCQYGESDKCPACQSGSEASDVADTMRCVWKDMVGQGKTEYGFLQWVKKNGPQYWAPMLERIDARIRAETTLKPCPFCQNEMLKQEHSAFHPGGVDCWLVTAGEKGTVYELDESDYPSWNNRPDQLPQMSLNAVEILATLRSRKNHQTSPRPAHIVEMLIDSYADARGLKALVHAREEQLHEESKGRGWSSSGYTGGVFGSEGGVVGSSGRDHVIKGSGGGTVTVDVMPGPHLKK